MSQKLKLGVLLSGQGTTLQNILDLIKESKLDAEVAVVISNDDTAYGLVRAQEASIDSKSVSTKGVDVYDYSSEIARQLALACVDLVVLAGFMKKFSPPDHFEIPVINVHPSLLPSFGGKGMYGSNVHQAVLDHGCKVSGCTVHFVDDEYDTGPIILQRPVNVEQNDTKETLQEKVQKEERLALPEAIQLFAEKEISIQGRKVNIS